MDAPRPAIPCEVSRPKTLHRLVTKQYILRFSSFQTLREAEVQRTFEVRCTWMTLHRPRRLTSRFISAMIILSSKVKCVAALVQAAPIEEGSAEQQEPITVRNRVAMGGRLAVYWHCTIARKGHTRRRACPQGDTPQVVCSAVTLSLSKSDGRTETTSGH